MGRIGNAWKALRGAQLADDERYVRRDEVPALTAQLADMELAIGSTLDKLNTMAARFRKREQRASEPDATHAPVPDTSGDPKAALRASYAAAKLAGRSHPTLHRD